MIREEIGRAKCAFSFFADERSFSDFIGYLMSAKRANKAAEYIEEEEEEESLSEEDEEGYDDDDDDDDEEEEEDDEDDE